MKRASQVLQSRALLPIFVLFLFISLTARSEESKCMATFANTLSASPFTRSALTSDLSQKLPEVFKFDPLSDRAKLRQEILPLVQNEDTRPYAVRAARADLRRRSNQLKLRLLDARNGDGVDTDAGARVWDVIVVGGGVHSAIIVSQLKKSNPALKVLVIDQAMDIGGTFGQVGDAFRMNSTNRPSDGNFGRVGKGNLNELPGATLQVPDVSALRFPVSGELGDVVVLNHVLSNAEYLLGTQSSTIYDRQSGSTRTDIFPRSSNARYRMNLRTSWDGAVGQASLNTFVFANKIVIATGLGQPNAVSGLRTAVEWLTERQREADPMASVADKTVAVVGAGDSAKVLIEWLMGLGPEDSYGNKGARKPPKEILWFGQTAQDCATYLDQTRARYAALGGGFRSGIIKPIPDKVTGVKGKSVVFGDKSVLVDVAIGAVGYNSSGILELSLKSLGRGSTISELSSPLVVQEILSDVTVARRVNNVVGLKSTGTPVDPHEIFFVGPAAGDTLVTEAERVNVAANGVSIFATGPRTARFTERYLSESTPSAPPLAESAIPSAPGTPGSGVRIGGGNFNVSTIAGIENSTLTGVDLAPVPLAGNLFGSSNLPVLPGQPRIANLGPYAWQYVEARLRTAAQEIAGTVQGDFVVSFRAVGSNQIRIYTLASDTAKSQTVAKYLALDVGTDPDLIDMIRRLTPADGGQRIEFVSRFDVQTQQASRGRSQFRVVPAPQVTSDAENVPYLAPMVAGFSDGPKLPE